MNKIKVTNSNLNMKTNLKKNKVGPLDGWQNLFIFSLCAGSVLTLLVGYNNVGFSGAFVEVIGIASLQVITAYYIYKRFAYALDFAKTLLVAALATNILVIIFNPAYISAALFPSFIIYYIIWISYLFSSKSMKITFPKKAYAPTLWGAFSVVYAFISPTYGLAFGFVGLIFFHDKSKGFQIILSIAGFLLSLITTVFILFG